MWGIFILRAFNGVFKVFLFTIEMRVKLFLKHVQFKKAIVLMYFQT